MVDCICTFSEKSLVIWVHYPDYKHLCMKVYTDQELVAAIKKGGSGRQEAIRFIYNKGDLRRKVVHFVRNNQGNDADGNDMFHEGIIVLDRNIREDKFRAESSIEGYLYSICRFLWQNQRRKKARVDLKEDATQMDQIETSTPELQLLSDEKKNLLHRALEQLGERCKRILELWQLSYSMEEIATEMDFSSAQMARKNKYRCQQSLLKFFKDQPQWKQWLS
ncbi:RNA polymerase subunit sigma-70 [Flavilitoribacter nigricans DSM 23189 = NBRC 102662]|uniref:RNA polymerase subunit sigma-70 n=2 Tax=Flavilitoribacter TaxID=2762562 RepID=A0A2D0N6I2_FLAN2|nr:RNA polymerase subunit sigma-70 [Flavilitoribacter nigricans DSM 23189 = NBRC 102662]